MDHYLTRLQNATRKYWNKSALNTLGGESFTYSQMATLIEKFHIFFDKAGLQKGQHIALWARNSARWGMSYLAVNTYEAVIVPILADFTPESVESLVNHSDSMALLTNADKWAKLDIAKMPEVKVVMDVDNLKILYCRKPEIEALWNSIDNLLAGKYPDGFGPEDVVYPTDNMDDLAVINYTSGSTGNPKGVMLTYRNFSATIEFSQVHRPTSDKNRMISMLPMAHMYGMAFEFIFEFIKGCHIFYLTRIPSPAIIAEAFGRIKPAVIIAVPLVIEKIIRKKVFPKIQNNRMRMLLHMPVISKKVKEKICDQVSNAFGGNFYEVIIGGAAFNQEVERFLHGVGFKYTVGYGATECAPIICYEDYKNFVPGSCGKAALHMMVRIDSPDPENVPGEILAKGPNVMLGYYKNEEVTKQTIDENGWYHSGDLGTMDGDGNVFIKGRSKNMLLGASGQNIYPEEIEDKLNSLALVAESVVVQKGDKLVALVYPDFDEAQSLNLGRSELEEIMEQNRQELNTMVPAYSKVSEIRIHDEEFEKTPKKSIKRFLYTAE